MPASAERTAVAWLKSLPAVVSAGAGVATRLPADPTFPFIVVQEIGGGDTLIQPVDKPYIQIDVYDDDWDKSTADDLALAIVGAFKTRLNVTIPAEGVTVLMVEWVAKRAVPEPGTGWTRFAIDSLWTNRED